MEETEEGGAPTATATVSPSPAESKVSENEAAVGLVDEGPCKEPIWEKRLMKACKNGELFSLSLSLSLSRARALVLSLYMYVCVCDCIHVRFCVTFLPSYLHKCSYVQGVWSTFRKLSITAHGETSPIPMGGLRSYSQRTTVTTNTNSTDSKTAHLYYPADFFPYIIIGHVDLVSALLEMGVNIDSKTNGGLTALMWATSRGHIEVITLLKNKGAKLRMIGQSLFPLISPKCHLIHDFHLLPTYRPAD